MLKSGVVQLEPGVERPGVSWESSHWSVTDTGQVRYKAGGAVVDGAQYLGRVSRDRVWRPDSLTLAQLRGAVGARAGREPGPVLRVAGEPNVIVSETLLQQLRPGRPHPLVAVVTPPAGPPLSLPLGELLPQGAVHLQPGLTHSGSFWQSQDRTVFTNGTILYRASGAVEQAGVEVGVVGPAGELQPLPGRLGGKNSTVDKLRQLHKWGKGS